MIQSVGISGPLSGLRVLDLSRILAGPTCTQLFADMGADVIKVEKPGTGDDTRTWGPPFVKSADGGDLAESAYYLSANRNKRSLALDIASKGDVEILLKILEKCDVLIENFKVDGLTKYGLSYAILKERFPELVYCSITGFGQTGPNSHKPGYDLMAQGYGGIMSITGEPDGQPMKVAVGITDVMTGMYASTAILAALRHRDQTGEGQHIDIALVDVQMSWLINAGTNYLLSGKVPKRLGNQHPNISPYQVFETRDGHMILAVGNDKQFQAFCTVIEKPELSEDSRFATNAQRLVNRVELIEILTPVVKNRNSTELLQALEDVLVPCGPINDLDQVFNSDQAQARNMRISMPFEGSADGKVELIGNPVKFSKTPVSYRQAPPQCGEHNDEIMAEFGVDRSEWFDRNN